MKLNKYTIITFLFLYNLFIPPFFNYLGTKSVILINGVILMFLILFTIFLRKLTFYNKTQKYIFILYLFCFFITYYLLLSISFLLNLNHIIERDIIEFYKPLLIFLSFLLGFHYVKSEKDIKYIVKLLEFSFYLLIIFGLVHFLHLNNFLIYLYTKESNAIYSRVTIPFYNPYDYAYVITLFFYFFLSLSIYFVKIRYFLSLLLSVFFLLLPQSKAIIIAFTLTFPVAAFIFFIKNKLNNNFKMLLFSLIVIVIIVVIMMFYQDKLNYLINGLILYMKGESNTSMDLRLQQINTTIKLLENNVIIFLFGNGVSKDIMQYLENNYVYYLFRYGFLGLFFIFIIPILFTALINFKLHLSQKDYYLKSFIYAFLLWIILLLVAAFGNNFTEQGRILFMMYFLIGITSKYYTLSRRNAR